MDIPLAQLKKEMVEKFQCPGCTVGCDTNCGSFALTNDDKGFSCKGWVPGTFLVPGGLVCLGLPTGFNKTGPVETNYINGGLYLTLFLSPNDLSDNPTSPTNIFAGEYNKLNLPVWAMEEDGYLFVRVISPRKCLPRVQVIKGGTFDLFKKFPEVPTPVNVAEFVSQID